MPVRRQSRSSWATKKAPRGRPLDQHCPPESCSIVPDQAKELREQASQAEGERVCERPQSALSHKAGLVSTTRRFELAILRGGNRHPTHSVAVAETHRGESDRSALPKTLHFGLQACHRHQDQERNPPPCSGSSGAPLRTATPSLTVPCRRINPKVANEQVRRIRKRTL